MSKTIPQLSTVPGGVQAANLFFEVARQITAGNFNGESERISGDALLALFAGTSTTINILARLNPTGVTYDPATTYELYDYLDVAYQGGHYAYIDPMPGAGHAPPNPAYWLLISTDGGGAGGGGESFYKVDTFSPAFVKTAESTVSIKAGTIVLVADTTLTVAADTAIVMPTLVAGSDYSIFACTDNTFRVSDPGSAPDGYLPEEVREIGGFHYAPGGNATAYNTGGDSTPQINEYSFWDLNFRPSCPNPRGMTFCPLGRFWVDIYPACRNPEARGSTSSFGGTISDGKDATTWPVNPTLLGGNGTITYPDAAAYNLMEFINAYGKELPSTAQFRNAAYGVVENQSRGINWTVAALVPASTSRWGVMMATGCGFMFGREYGTEAAIETTAAYGDVVGGRGRAWAYGTGTGVTQLMHGGGGLNGANSGSRCTHYLENPNTSTLGIGARGYASHFAVGNGQPYPPSL